MSSFSYFAVDRGTLIGGHSEGTEYTFEVPLARFDASPKFNKRTVKSLSGVRSTILHNVESEFDVTTVPTKDPATLASLRELLYSCAGGEAFTLDAFGSIATPSNPRSYQLIGSYTERLVDLSGFYTFNFKVVEI